MFQRLKDENIVVSVWAALLLGSRMGEFHDFMVGKAIDEGLAPPVVFGTSVDALF